jgi:hypothetical protein
MEDHIHEHASTGERCPRCHEYLVSSSRPRSVLEAVLSTFRVPIRRCGRCFHRYVIFFGLPIDRAAHA